MGGHPTKYVIHGFEGLENLRFWTERRKRSRQWMQMRSSCLFRSPYCENSSVLKLFLWVKGISLLLCIAPPWVVRWLSDLRCVGSFFTYVWGEKRRCGSPKCAGRHPNSRRCWPDLARQCYRPTEILSPGGNLSRDFFYWYGTWRM